MNKNPKNVTEHFEKMAAEYDYWKNKNWYYYEELKRIARVYANGAKNVLDAGCGTGNILRSINIKRGIGIDVSPAMIKIARERNADRKNIEFFSSNIASFQTREKFDLILLMDVIEHLTDPKAVILSLKNLSSNTGRIVITMANPLWEPILILGEKLGLKMPEGPHYRLPGDQLITMAKTSGLRLETREWCLIFPKYIPFISWLVNYLGRLPLLKRLCVIEVFVFNQIAPVGKIN